MQIANSVGYARGCDILRCPISWRGDGVCHSYCNNPDCGFDGGDCECSSYYALTVPPPPILALGAGDTRATNAAASVVN